jgi:hypothetical protein
MTIGCTAVPVTVIWVLTAPRAVVAVRIYVPATAAVAAHERDGKTAGVRLRQQSHPS